MDTSAITCHCLLTLTQFSFHFTLYYSHSFSDPSPAVLHSELNFLLLKQKLEKANLCPVTSSRHVTPCCFYFRSVRNEMKCFIPDLMHFGDHVLTSSNR